MESDCFDCSSTMVSSNFCNASGEDDVDVVRFVDDTAAGSSLRGLLSLLLLVETEANS